MQKEFYLLEYEEDGKTVKQITPNAQIGLIGAYIDKLPIEIDIMLELGIVEKVIEQNKIYYKIIKEI